MWTHSILLVQFAPTSNSPPSIQSGELHLTWFSAEIEVSNADGPVGNASSSFARAWASLWVRRWISSCNFPSSSILFAEVILRFFEHVETLSIACWRSASVEFKSWMHFCRSKRFRVLFNCNSESLSQTRKCRIERKTQAVVEYDISIILMRICFTALHCCYVRYTCILCFKSQRELA